MKTYTTIDDFKWAEIFPALGDFAQDFDVDAIAREASEYDASVGGFYLRGDLECDDDAFWALCERHDIS